MLASRALRNFRRFSAGARACSDAKGDSSDRDGLASFLNVVQSTQKELIAKQQAELGEEDAQLIGDGAEKPRFTKLLRNSELVRLGYIKKGFVTKGVVTNVVNQTIFVDYGGKFSLVTQKPSTNAEFYVRGAEVLANIVDWELTARFIGAETDSTLCESGGRVIKLLSSPLKVGGSMTWRDDDLSKADVDHSEIDQYLNNMQANEEQPEKQ